MINFNFNNHPYTHPIPVNIVHLFMGSRNHPVYWRHKSNGSQKGNTQITLHLAPSVFLKKENQVLCIENTPMLKYIISTYNARTVN